MQRNPRHVEGIASFRLGAKFGTSGMTTPLMLHHVDRNVAVLRQASYEIAERQRTLYFMWALGPSNGTRQNQGSPVSA